LLRFDAFGSVVEIVLNQEAWFIHPSFAGLAGTLTGRR
jgi:hypothetical protein